MRGPDPPPGSGPAAAHGDGACGTPRRQRERAGRWPGSGLGPRTPLRASRLRLRLHVGRPARIPRLDGAADRLPPPAAARGAHGRHRRRHGTLPAPPAGVRRRGDAGRLRRPLAAHARPAAARSAPPARTGDGRGVRGRDPRAGRPPGGAPVPGLRRRRRQGGGAPLLGPAVDAVRPGAAARAGRADPHRDAPAEARIPALPRGAGPLRRPPARAGAHRGGAAPRRPRSPHHLRAVPRRRRTRPLDSSGGGTLDVGALHLLRRRTRRRAGRGGQERGRTPRRRAALPRPLRLRQGTSRPRGGRGGPRRRAEGPGRRPVRVSVQTSPPIEGSRCESGADPQP
ncbi:hypothetical protein H181DRAFT_01221 [Streptomyces sp. WMMB 714]|nr:hypothetical protein H181DRAFT_01221 [Streptomyces sp. WMMB 714]